MKFIGQYIQDFIARFRSDVYLEDVSTGTIASGANLGLDSNNKIVKNTVGGGGTTDLTSDVTGVLPIANGGTNSNSAANARTALGVDAAGTDNSTNVTLAGTPDYITISGQEITRNQIDLANDVTGTLAAGNVATLNQSTTGSAATLTTERDLQVNLSSTSTDGFDGGSNATDIGVKNALAVGNGGTGATTLTSNSVLTGNGTSAIQAESGLTYSSESLFVGDDDDGIAQIRRTPHSDDTGGSLYVRGGDATAGQTDKDGGILRLYGGRGTSNGNGGGVTIFTSFATGSTGTVLHTNARSVASFRSDGDTILGGDLTFEGPVIDGNDTTFSITEQTANRTITVPDASGTMALTGINYNYQYITFVGNSTANTSSNGYWEYPTANGISNHLWTQPVLTKVDGTDNRDTTTVGNEVGIDRLNQGSAGIRIPYAGTIVGFTGSGRNASGDRVYYAGLFVGTPDWGTNNKINAELVAVAAADNNSGSYHSRPAKLEDLSRSYSIAAGDVIYPALKGSGTNADILQASITVVIKTAIV